MTSEMIWIIDSDLQSSASAKEALEGAGFKVTTRTKASGAGAMILRSKPDLILVEVTLAGLSGPGFITTVRKTAGIDTTRMYLYSADDPGELAKRAAECGANGYIHKEEDLSKLVASVTRALRQKPGAVEAQKKSPTRADTVRILCVDDNPLILKMYSRVLGKSTECGGVSLAEEALKMMTTADPPQVVICDLLMPGMTGFELLAAAERHDPKWRDRIIFVSGHREHFERDLAKWTGPMLEKPFDSETLLAAVMRTANAQMA